MAACVYLFDSHYILLLRYTTQLARLHLSEADMTIGTGIAIAIDRASNQTQARILADYVQRQQLDVSQMPSDCLLFLIAQPCWMD